MATLVLLGGCTEEKKEWPLLPSTVSFRIDVFPVGKEGNVEIRVEATDPLVWSVTQGEDPLVPKSRVLSVYRSQRTPEGEYVVPANEMPQVGTYRVEGPYLYFDPEYPPQDAEPWVVEFQPGLLHPQLFAPEINRPIYKKFGGQETTVKRPQVYTMFPQGLVPANAINVTVVFSEPMKKGSELQFVSLIEKESGLEVEHAFLPTVQWEVLQGAYHCLYLQFDPKRQVDGQREVERGTRRKGPQPVLEAGKSYTLKIFGDWESEAGVPIDNFGVEFDFDAGPVDTTAPNPKRWTIQNVRPGTTDGMRVDFGESYSYRTLWRSIGVRKADGTLVPAAFAEPLATAQGWQFQPSVNWEAGEYELTINNRLEDQAGNTIDGPLELAEDGLPVIREFKTVTRKFTVTNEASGQ